METELKQLRQKAESYLHEGKFSAECIRRYNYSWDRLKKFMSENEYQQFNQEVEDAFIMHRFGTTIRKGMQKWQKSECHHIDILLDIQTGMPIRLWDVKHKTYNFDGPEKHVYEEFIDEISRLKARASICSDIERLYLLYSFLQEHSISIKELTPADLVQYLIELDKRKPGPSRNNYISLTRSFFKYLCRNKLLNDNKEALWLSLLQHRDISRGKIPGTFTAEQVERIIQSIDRSQGKGKRDYAITLLAARYGMRSSDITGLRFCNIDWENNRLSFVQQKTRKRVTLPLTEEVGTAIIDYIQHARPGVESPFIFISANAPYRPISSTGVSGKIGNWMRIAGIHQPDVKQGLHVFRHSLATNLMGLNEPIPVISEILGHSCSDTTMDYLRVSVPMLRKCALEVPIVPSTFYGNLYESSLD